MPVDWSRPGAVLLRQTPGPHNALGQVVVRFPNNHMVYLHDTPARSPSGVNPSRR